MTTTISNIGINAPTGQTRSLNYLPLFSFFQAFQNLVKFRVLNFLFFLKRLDPTRGAMKTSSKMRTIQLLINSKKVATTN